MSHAALASKSPQGNLAAAKSLRSSFNLFSLVSPRWLYQCTKAESDNSVNRVDGCDCVNSGRARTCRQALPSGLFDSRQAASGRISDLMRCGWPSRVGYRPSPASPTDSGQPASAWFQVLAYSGAPTESRDRPWR